MIVHQPPAIIHPAPPVYYAVVKRKGGATYFWCGQIVEQNVFWENFAGWIRSDKKAPCPKGKY